jgi:hypothetical protein
MITAIIHRFRGTKRETSIAWENQISKFEQFHGTELILEPSQKAKCNPKNIQNHGGLKQ